MTLASAQGRLTGGASDPFVYFAYGSNMSSQRLRQRTPSAQALGTAYLGAYRLMWHKAGQDGSGKCDIVSTGDASDGVWGVLYAIAAHDKPRLDRAEGLGQGYDLKPVEVLAGAAPVRAWAYCATAIDALLRPFDWYLAYVRAGAAEHGLPPAYRQMIESVASVPDPDPQRAAQHRAGKLTSGEARCG